MPVALESNAFFWGIEYLATFCCGMCGGLAAVRKGYDIFAILVSPHGSPHWVEASSVTCCWVFRHQSACQTRVW